MLLQLSSWQEVETYLQGSTGIIIPIGSTEQHGPRGLLGTDALCPQILAEGVHDKINVMVAPTLNIGIAQHHLDFAGTITLRPTTLIAMIQDMIDSLLRHGFTHFYFLNGHGGNIAPLMTTFAEIYYPYSIQAKSPDRVPKFKLRNWWELSAVTKLSAKLFGTSEGKHATPSEISLTYYAYPQAVKQITATPDIAPDGPIQDAHDFRKRFPDGRIISNSNLATIDAGKLIYEAATMNLISDYQEFIAST